MAFDNDLPDRRLDNVFEAVVEPRGSHPMAVTEGRAWRPFDLLTPPLVVPLGFAFAILAYGLWARW
jgi:hypothetical protein